MTDLSPDSAAQSIPPGPAYVGRVLTSTAIVLGTLVLLLLLWTAREVVLLLFGGLLLAVLLRFAGNALARRSGLGDSAAVAIVLAGFVGLLVAAGWLLGPGIVDEVRELQSGLGRSIGELRERLDAHPVGASLVESLPGNGNGDDDGGDGYQALWQRVGGITATALGALSAATIVLFVGIFFAFNPGLYLAGMLRLVPVPRRARLHDVLEQISSTLRWWLAGQLISMLFLWLSTWLALYLLGVPMAFILGLLTGLLTFIPYLGPLLAIVPIALVALVESPMLALTATAVFFVIQAVESNVLMPLVFQRLVHLPPALTIAAQVVMGTLGGLIGVALATPLLAVVLVMVRTLYVEDVLRDDLDRPALPAADPPPG